MNKYIAGLIYQDLNLPNNGRKANQTAELILRIEQLKRENQRLKYESEFNQIAYENEGTEIMSPLHLEMSREMEQVA